MTVLLHALRVTTLERQLILATCYGLAILFGVIAAYTIYKNWRTPSNAVRSRQHAVSCTSLLCITVALAFTLLSLILTRTVGTLVSY